MTRRDWLDVALIGLLIGQFAAVLWLLAYYIATQPAAVPWMQGILPSLLPLVPVLNG